jgi:hypothetical protein
VLKQMIAAVVMVMVVNQSINRGSSHRSRLLSHT